MANLFNTYLYKPLLAALIFIYENLAFSDLGLAIIILTAFIRIVLFPIFYKGAKDQALMSRLQPQIRKIQEEHKSNKEEQTKRLMALYRENKLNPFSGLFLLIIQLPIIIALYQVFLKELNNSVFASQFFLNLIDLSERNLVVALLASLLQYLQGKLSLPKDSTAKNSNQFAVMGKMMIYMGPIFTFAILVSLPSALGLYWSVSTLFSIIQQVYINRKLKTHG